MTRLHVIHDTKMAMTLPDTNHVPRLLRPEILTCLGSGWMRELR